MTKYYADASGNYLGGFDGATPPAGAIEVSLAPTDASQKWNGSAWGFSLADAKAMMWKKIHDERERRKFTGGFLVGTLWFDSDLNSRADYIAMLSRATRLASLPTFVFHAAWKTMSGVTTPMTVANLVLIEDKAFANDKLIHDNAEAHKVAMEASPTPLSYDYSTGWPAMYGG